MTSKNAPTLLFIIVLSLIGSAFTIQLSKKSIKFRLRHANTMEQCQALTPSEGCVWLYSNYLTKIEVCKNVPDLRSAEFDFDNKSLSVLPGPDTIVTLWEDYNYTGNSKVRNTNTNYQLLDFPCAVSSVQVASSKGYVIRGYIKDAQTNLVLSSSIVKDTQIIFMSSAGKNYTATVDTNSSTYSIQLPVGSYRRVASLTNYVVTTSPVEVTGPSDETNSVNTVLFSLIFQGWRIVLTWDATKDRDLDSYTLLPDNSKVYYKTKVSADKTAVLDIDNRNGTGPETTSYGNFTSSSTGTYRYFVSSYSKLVPIAKSSALVTVYHGDAEIGQFSAPNNSAQGYWWEVFNVVIAGAQQTLNPVNQIKTSMA